MQCPNDGQTLAMTTREGIEIDYCPTCRGVWLDRGELDKLIERSAATTATATAAPAAAPEGPARRYRDDDDDDDDRKRQRPFGHGDHDDRDRDRGAYGRPKRKSFLDDLFDFG